MGQDNLVGTGENAVARRLFDDAPAFDFFQAVRLLRLLAHQRGSRSDRLAEAVRFRTNPSLEFPASAVYDLEPPDRADGAAIMTVNFLGVHGPSGTLPRHYTELMRRLEREHRGPERRALRDWFDLFNDRFVALFYEAWEKYRFWLAAERGAWTAAEPDTFTLCLLSLIGLGTCGMRHRFQIRADDGRWPRSVLDEVRDLGLLRYAGLLAQRKRNALGLEQLLRDYFDQPVQVLQFQGRWLPVSKASQTRLGEGLETCALGVGTLVGDRVWDVESKVRLRVGPLAYRHFLQFMPESSCATNRKAIFLLGLLARFYLGPNLDWDVQLVLDSGEVPDCQLTDGPPGPRLGWNTWLQPDPLRGGAEDAVFSSEECSW